MRTRSVWIAIGSLLVSGVQASERRRLGEDARFVPCELGEALANARARQRLGREIDVEPVVARLGLAQAAPEAREARVLDAVREQPEALAAARLDQRAAEQEVDEPRGLARAHAVAQPPRVGRRAQRAQAQAALAHHRDHLL